jgi:formylmethanofuran dehydrogenase subunit C
MPLILTSKSPLSPGVNAEGLLPERLNGKSLSEIGSLNILDGSRTKSLADLFTIEGDAIDNVLEIRGDVTGLDRLGSEMTTGKIVVHRSCGTHCGAEMRGGEINVYGSVLHSAGAQMSGGELIVHTDAGENLGGVFPGSMRGQRGGLILVGGNAGATAGQFQRRGILIVLGNSGDETGFAQRAGTIIVGGTSGARTGYTMRRGTICVLQSTSSKEKNRVASQSSSSVHEDFPTMLAPGRFVTGYRGRPTVLRLLETSFKKIIADHSIMLAKNDFSTAWQRDFQLYHGDMLELGRGEVWM